MTFQANLATVALASAATTMHTVLADESLSCTPIKDIYDDGADMCQNMWDDAFEAVDDNEPSYTMAAFYTEKNPNDAVSDSFNLEGANDTCYLADYHHKKTPGPEELKECVAFHKDSCCSAEKIIDFEAVHNLYGPEYRWDRCGKISPACERFFVEEACFYECDPNSGYFRKFPDAEVADQLTPELMKGRIKYVAKCNHKDKTEWPNQDKKEFEKWFAANNATVCSGVEHNRWQMYKMPIKKSYCDGWYNACKNELFCAKHHGSFLDCAKEPLDKKNTLPLGAIVGLVFLSLFLIAASIFSAVLVVKERRGKPMFTSIPMDDTEMESKKF